jgi:hypothetical protein
VEQSTVKMNGKLNLQGGITDGTLSNKKE